jgi:hypothetical protein
VKAVAWRAQRQPARRRGTASARAVRRDLDRLLAELGAKRVFLAEGGSCLIGPSDERWDVVQLVRYPSIQAFMSLSSSDEVSERNR